MKIGEKIEEFDSEIQKGRVVGKFSEKGQVFSEVCFPVHWSWVVFSDVWKLFNLQNWDSRGEFLREKMQFCTAPCKARSTSNT